EEGRSISTELRARMANLEKAAAGVEAHRSTILRSYSERLQSRMLEVLGAQVERESAAGGSRVGGSQRHSRRTRTAECACEAFPGLARSRRRSGQEDGLFVAGNEPRSQYDAFQNFGLGRRGLEGHRDGSADEV